MMSKNSMPLWRFCKSKCEKTHGAGPLFEVQMSKDGTSLWREARFQVKMYKTPQTNFRSADVETWREVHLQVKALKTRRARPLFEGLINQNGMPLWHEAHLQVKMCKVLAHFKSLR